MKDEKEFKKELHALVNKFRKRKRPSGLTLRIIAKLLLEEGENCRVASINADHFHDIWVRL